MCTYVCLCVHVFLVQACMHVHIYVHVSGGQTEVGTLCLPQLLPTLFLSQSLPEPELQGSSVSSERGLQAPQLFMWIWGSEFK